MTLRIAAAVAVLALAAQAQTTWYVDVNGTPPGTGTQADPYTSIQYAISQGSTLPGDTVLVLPGTYQEVIDFLGKAIEVRTTGGPQVTLIDAGPVGGDAVSFLSGESATSLLEGFRVMRSPSSTPFGSGIAAIDASPTIRGCIIEGHFASTFDSGGGGIRMVNSNARIELCALVNNYADPFGGGAYIDGGAPSFTDCTFTSNYSGFGDGAYVANSSADFFRCTFTENGGDQCSLLSYGGAVSIGGSDGLFVDCVFDTNFGGGCRVGTGIAHFVRCSITNNCLDGGGGILAQSSSLLLLDECIVSGNTGFNYHGGGLWIEGANVVIQDSTISSNWAGIDAHNGGGIYQLGGTLTLLDTEVIGNRTFARGGGLYIDGEALIQGCRIAFNRSCHDWPSDIPRGAGVWCSPESSVSIFRSVIAGNEVNNGDCYSQYHVGGPPPEYGYGGGVYGPASIVNSVVWGNTALGGGGVQHATLLNSVVWNNTAGVSANVGGATQASYSAIQAGWPGIGNLDEPPRFWAPQVGDFNLMPGSPCIDAGDPASPADPDGSRADIGVFPFDPTYCGDPFTYCQGKTNSLGCVPFLTTNGFPSATSTEPFEIVANDILPGEAGFLIYGFNKNMLGFHGGTLCVKAPIARVLPPKFAKSNGAPPCTGRLILGFNKRIQSGVDVLLMPGQTVYAQIRQRDPQDPAGFGDGLTDAVQFTICP